jgi:uncharacterized OB-fold protein
MASPYWRLIDCRNRRTTIYQLDDHNNPNRRETAKVSSTGLPDAAKPAIVPTAANRFFWEGAARNRLLVLRCDACGHFSHPAPDRCPVCLSPDLAPTRMSGRGTIFSFTIIRRAFHPGFAADLPYVAALVELAEQAGLHLITNIVGGAAAGPRIGMEVAVEFEPYGDFARPVFRPVASEPAA